MKDAIVRLRLTFHKGTRPSLMTPAFTTMPKTPLSSVVKTAIAPVRGRLPEGQETSSLSPLELLDAYWKSKDESETERALLSEPAQDLISEVHSGDA